MMEQAGAAPDVARLSDEEETRMSHGARRRPAAAPSALGRAYLRARGHEGGCIAIVGLRGRAPTTWSGAACAPAALLRAGGGVALGTRPGAAWLRGRYAAPYLRDDLLDRGVMVETLETATTWSNLHALHDAVGGRPAGVALGARARRRW